MKLTSNYRVSGAHWTKREFNPADPADLDEYRFFMRNSHWRSGCPFVVEWPHTNAVSMIEHKIVKQHIGSIIKTVKEKV